ncbi:carboxymuconolactone decarboxylase family protein [Actinomycetospora sp.]|jgi:alkylhydroperoxidase family enzyme|uniref:carboxymuconolactone decarboxylase family protein n=1 Tax=Actinomycetospora sp. TaxID=1872135 RepID=UPI002F3ED1D5
MARLDDADTDPAPGPSGEVTERILARRGGTLTPLDRMLLHSPPIADGWNALLGAVRTGAELADDVRELAVLRVATLNGADYEWRAHEPVGRDAGLGDTEIAVLRGGTAGDGATGDGAMGARADDVLAPRLAAALAYTDAMTRHVTVPDAVFAALGDHFDDREIVELTATVAAYNLVSRFLVALQVGEQRRDAA